MPPSDRSPRLQAELERIAAERLAAQREVERLYRHEFVRVMAECIGWSCTGCFLLLLAMHLTDMAIAQVSFWGGFLVGYAGITYSLIAAYNRGTERGDW